MSFTLGKKKSTHVFLCLIFFEQTLQQQSFIPFKIRVQKSRKERINLKKKIKKTTKFFFLLLRKKKLTKTEKSSNKRDYINEMFSLKRPMENRATTIEQQRGEKKKPSRTNVTIIKEEIKKI